MLLKTIYSAWLLTSVAQAVAIERGEEEHAGLERRAGCPRGKYLDAKGVCATCPTDASACALKAGKVEIIACKTRFLSPAKTQCVSSCPRGYAGLNHQCRTCTSLGFPNAPTCTATAATSCSYPYLLSQITGKCGRECEDGYFGIMNTGGAPRACSKCDTKFKHATACNWYSPFTCEAGFDVFNSACVPVCPSTMYHGDDGICMTCPQSNALTCSAWAAYTCEPGFTLYGSHCLKTSTFSNGPYSLMKHTVIGGQIYPEDQSSGYDLSDCAALCSQVASPFVKWVNAAPDDISSCWCSDGPLENMWEGDWDGTKSVTYSMSKELSCAEVAAAVPDNTFATLDCVDVTFTGGKCSRISDGGECYPPLDL